MSMLVIPLTPLIFLLPKTVVKHLALQSYQWSVPDEDCSRAHSQHLVRYLRFNINKSICDIIGILTYITILLYWKTLLSFYGQ
jgi:hypothetical protein